MAQYEFLKRRQIITGQLDEFDFDYGAKTNGQIAVPGWNYTGKKWQKVGHVRGRIGRVYRPKD